MKKFQRSRARLEFEKSYFDATPHYKFRGLETTRKKKEVPTLKCNPLTQMRRRQEFLACSCPKWEFL